MLVLKQYVNEIIGMCDKIILLFVYIVFCL